MGNGLVRGVRPPAPVEATRDAGVFRICHKSSGRWFIGACLDVPAALRRQRFHLEVGSHPNGALQREWKIEGAAAFAFETLATLVPPARTGTDPRPELRRLEALWHGRLRALYGAGYHDETTPGV
jgi:hypothetical protein